MTWIVLEDKDYKHAFQEIKKQRDRGAGIIATSILQDHLLAAIRTRISYHRNIADNMFKGAGALSDFGTQIDLGYLLDLYSDFVREQLHIIRVIRNDFAHNSQPVSFRSQRSKCAELTPPRQASRVWREKIKPSERKNIMKLTSLYYSNNPRVQFLNAIKRYTMHLTIQTMQARTTDVWRRHPNKAPQPAKLLPDILEIQPLSQSRPKDQHAKKRRRQPQPSGA